MPARRVKIDVFDDKGNKVTIAIEGEVTRSKVLQVLDLVELLGGVPPLEPQEESVSGETSKLEKVRKVIERSFPVGWFTSRELQSAYEDLMNEPIGLSTVSTYLGRLALRGALVRAGSAVGRRYKLRRILSLQEKRAMG